MYNRTKSPAFLIHLHFLFEHPTHQTTSTHSPFHSHIHITGVGGGVWAAKTITNEPYAFQMSRSILMQCFVAESLSQYYALMRAAKRKCPNPHRRVGVTLMFYLRPGFR